MTIFWNSKNILKIIIYLNMIQKIGIYSNMEHITNKVSKPFINYLNYLFPKKTLL